MNFSKVIGAAFVAAVCLAAPAEAKVYDFSFIGSNYTFTGEFSTSNTLNASGFYDITGGSGQVISAAPGQAHGLVGLVAGNGDSLSYGGTENYSNYYSATSNTFAGQGAQFQGISPNPGGPGFFTFGANLYDAVDSGFGGCSGTCLSITPDSGFYNPGDVGSLTISAVPEPATWAMLLMGFFGVGFMMRGARRKEALSVA